MMMMMMVVVKTREEDVMREKNKRLGLWSSLKIQWVPPKDFFLKQRSRIYLYEFSFIVLAILLCFSRDVVFSGLYLPLSRTVLPVETNFEPGAGKYARKAIKI